MSAGPAAPPRRGRWRALHPEHAARYHPKDRAWAKVVVWEMTEAEALATAYQMGAQGRRDAFEEGWLVAELHRVWKWSLGEVAERLVRSKSWVSKRLALVEELPEWMAQEVAVGRIGAHAAARVGGGR